MVAFLDYGGVQKSMWEQILIFDTAEKRSLVVTLNPSFSQDKLREGPVLSEVEGSQVWEHMRFFPFAEPVLEARSGPKGSE